MPLIVAFLFTILPAAGKASSLGTKPREYHSFSVWSIAFAIYSNEKKFHSPAIKQPGSSFLDRNYRLLYLVRYILPKKAFSNIYEIAKTKNLTSRCAILKIA